jgi:hypothetical protein
MSDDLDNILKLVCSENEIDDEELQQMIMSYLKKERDREEHEDDKYMVPYSLSEIWADDQ